MLTVFARQTLLDRVDALRLECHCYYQSTVLYFTWRFFYVNKRICPEIYSEILYKSMVTLG